MGIPVMDILIPVNACYYNTNVGLNINYDAVQKVPSTYSLQIIYFLIMKESSDGSFGVDEVDVPASSSKRESQQFKALFLKNARLQSKQIGTNLCQILTPVLCIFFTYVMKTLAEDGVPVGAKFDPLYYPFKFNDYVDFDQINSDSRNHLKWLAYNCRDQCDEQLLGFNNGEDREGILGLIPVQENTTTFYPNVMLDKNDSLEMEVPFFLKVNESSVDATLYKRLQVLSKTDIDFLKDQGGLDYAPDGAYDITLLTADSIQFDVKVNDMRDLEMHRANGLSKLNFFRNVTNKNVQVKIKEYNTYAGLLEATHMLTAAFINASMTAGYLTMPEVEGGVTFVDTIISFIAVLIFPIALSLLFPVFLYSVVLEKEEKLIQMMKMNGMKISSYWIVYFVFNLILSFFTNLIFYILGYFLTNMRFFVETDGKLMFVVLLGWSLSQIGMAVFFQTFLNKSRSANIIGYLISIWTSIIGSTLSIGVYQYPLQMPYGLRMFAPFGFVRILYTMLTACSEGRCFGNVGNITEEMTDCIIYLYLNFIFFFVLGTYLFEIVPQEFGVTRSPLFPLKIASNFFKGCFSSRENNKSDQILQEDDNLKDYIDKDEEDSMSKNERSSLLTNENVINENPLVINNLRKLYKKEGRAGMYPAVRSFNLKVGPKETFGLLGPNGAGKTTLISMITGMFEPNYGNAWIGGYDIKNNVAKSQLQMGVCPQFDLLWPQLTVEEHLYFYARLKGIPSKLIAKKVETALKDVNLTNFKNFPSSSLSGGMKRRLSVAISLVGDPQIVFLDEPSTGLDPENRRQLWEVLAKCQKDRAIFITTHMMEEADALCNRVGIITSGVLRTVAPQTTLKKIYGGGYRLTISTVKEERRLVDRNSIHMIEGEGRVEELNENYDAMEDKNIRKSIDSFVQAQEKQNKRKNQKKVDEVSKFMDINFQGSFLEKQFNGYLIFKVPLKYKVSDIFCMMEKMEKQLDIVDVAITTSSLEDVFMNVVKQYDSDEKNRNKEKVDESQNFMSFPSERVELNTQKKPVRESQFESIVSKKRQSVMSGKGQKPMPNGDEDGDQNEDRVEEEENQEDKNQNQAAQQQSFQNNQQSQRSDDYY